MTDRFNVTQKYLMTRGQAIGFPYQPFTQFIKGKNDVYGVVIDIPMSADVLTTAASTQALLRSTETWYRLLILSLQTQVSSFPNVRRPSSMTSPRAGLTISSS